MATAALGWSSTVNFTDASPWFSRFRGIVGPYQRGAGPSCRFTFLSDGPCFVSTGRRPTFGAWIGQPFTAMVSSTAKRDRTRRAHVAATALERPRRSPLAL